MPSADGSPLAQIFRPNVPSKNDPRRRTASTAAASSTAARDNEAFKELIKQAQSDKGWQERSRQTRPQQSSPVQVLLLPLNCMLTRLTSLAHAVLLGLLSLSTNVMISITLAANQCLDGQYQVPIGKEELSMYMPPRMHHSCYV